MICAEFKSLLASSSKTSSGGIGSWLGMLSFRSFTLFRIAFSPGARERGEKETERGERRQRGETDRQTEGERQRRTRERETRLRVRQKERDRNR
jgi:hypothetical protein